MPNAAMPAPCPRLSERGGRARTARSSSCASLFRHFQGPGRRGRRRQPREDLLFRSELLLAALGHDQNIVDTGNGTRTMGYHDRDGATRPQAENGPGQRFVAFGVEVRIGLVENDQERIAIESARERDALGLSGG